MTKKNVMVLLLIIIIIGLAGWYIVSINSNKENVGIANPASVYCQEQGGRSEIVSNPDGSQAGNCLFADGSKCDEWAFFRKECEPGAK